MSRCNSCFLTFIWISQEAGKVVWYSHLLKRFLHFVVIYTVKGFGVINKAKVDVFSGILFFLDNPTDVHSLISGSSSFSKTHLNIWNFMVDVLLKPGLENFVPATEWNTNTAEWFKSLYFNTCFLQLLYFISLAQQPTGQAAKHYDSETIQCAGAGRDYLYLDLFTAAKTLFWGNSLST